VPSVVSTFSAFSTFRVQYRVHYFQLLCIVFFCFSLGETLEFIPVKEGDGGTYFCLAKNDVGSSDELSVTFDVLYPPRNVQTTPQRLIDLDVGRNNVEFKCDADANPIAKYEWLQKLPENPSDSGSGSESGAGHRGQIYSRGFGKSLRMKNVTYEHEGKWACVATNTIKGLLKKASSSRIEFLSNRVPLEASSSQSEFLSRRVPLEASSSGSEFLWKGVPLEASSSGSEFLWKRVPLEASSSGSVFLWHGSEFLWHGSEFLWYGSEFLWHGSEFIWKRVHLEASSSGSEFLW
jgi:hypothetical protein